MRPRFTAAAPRCHACAAPALLAASAAQFLEINYEDMQCVNAVLERAGLAAALQDDLANTYFLPTDAAFLLDLGVSARGGAGGRHWPSWPCPTQLLCCFSVLALATAAAARCRRLQTASAHAPPCPAAANSAGAEHHERGQRAAEPDGAADQGHD